MPSHRENGRASRNRQSHRAPAHREIRSHRPPREPRRRGLLLAIGVLVLLSLGGGAFLFNRLHTGTRPATTTALDLDSRSRQTPQAASRDFNRLAPTLTPSAAASPSPTPVRPSTPAARPSSKAAIAAACLAYQGNQRIACTLLPSFGFTLDQMAPLVNLWNGESGWRTDATNPGSGAYGIPQALPASKLAAAGSDWRTSAATQIRWGLGYIKKVYGTPANAWSLWESRSPHWY